MDKLIRERIKIQAGQPVFGTVIIDCDLIVYLNISDELLRKRTRSRNVMYEDAKSMKDNIETQLKENDIPVINIDI